VKTFSASSRAGIQGRVLSCNAAFDLFDPYRVSKEMMQGVLAEKCMPDAVICGDDEWAIGAMAAAREAGLRIPQQIAFTGYDNTSQGKYIDVPLTTVAQPSKAMAGRAVAILLAMIHKENIGRIPHLTQFPCELIIRRSCGS